MTTVYHGSPSKFSIFDYGRIRENGTMEGIGFYFTPVKRIAEGYGEDGYLYTVNFKGKKALSDNSLTLTRQAFQEKFLLPLHQATDYLTNWGEVDYEGFETVLERATEGDFDNAEDDVSLISGIINGCGDAETALTILYRELGYDSIITKAEWGSGADIYIALVHDAYEIVKVEKQTKKGQVK